MPQTRRKRLDSTAGSRIFRPTIQSRNAAMNIRSIGSKLALGASLFAFAACSSLKVGPAQGDAALAGRTTYRSVPDLTADAAGGTANLGYWRDRIAASVSTSLDRKGFRQAATGKPDLYVAFHFVTKRGATVTTFNNYSGYRLPASMAKRSSDIALIGDHSGGTNAVGTLIIDLIDPAKKEVVWRGWGRGPLRPDLLPDTREHRIDLVVEKILKPVAKR
jgi:hypothetical protein